MHDIEANAKFLITEGITMASEAFLLGVPYLLISPLKCGYIDYQTEHYPKLCHHSFDQEDIMNWVLYMISTDSKNNLKPLINEHTIDPTSFLVWFVENYPKSMTILKQNPSYQNQFI